jgi:hypothetical protein
MHSPPCVSTVTSERPAAGLALGGLDGDPDGTGGDEAVEQADRTMTRIAVTAANVRRGAR